MECVDYYFKGEMITQQSLNFMPYMYVHVVQAVNKLLLLVLWQHTVLCVVVQNRTLELGYPICTLPPSFLVGSYLLPSP